MRHGPKASASGEKDALAPTFEKSISQSFEKMGLDQETGLVHVTSSTLPRAEKTAQSIDSKLGKTAHRHGEGIRSSKGLSAHFKEAGPGVPESQSSDLKKIMEMQSRLEPPIRAAIAKDGVGLSSEEQEIEVRNRIDMEVMKEFFADDARPPADRHFQTSYHELATGLAKRYFAFGRRIKDLEKMRSGGQQPVDEPYLEIDVSHSFDIAAFLKKYLVFKDGRAAITMSGNDFFKQLGGMIRESGSINLNYQLNEGQVILEVDGEFEPGRKFSGIIDLNKEYEKEN